MAYQRKTTDEFQIEAVIDFGDGDGWETLEAAKAQSKESNITKISIWDDGCGVEVIINAEGKLIVLESGGAPVVGILGNIRNFRHLPRLAQTVMRKWKRGYDGDPAAAHLRVTVTRSGQAYTEYA